MALHIRKIPGFRQSPHAKSEAYKKSPNGTVEVGSEKANADYTDAEQAAVATGNMQVVLVSVDSLAALKKAYPNYFLDTDRFIALLKEFLAKK